MWNKPSTGTILPEMSDVTMSLTARPCFLRISMTRLFSLDKLLKGKNHNTI